MTAAGTPDESGGAGSSVGDVSTRSATAVAAEERGRTVVADRVVEKIAARAALEVPHAQGLQRSIAGRGVGRPVVRTRAAVDGTIASLSLELAIDFPSPVRTVTREVREHVGSRVSELCSLRVDHVDITVSALLRPDESTRRVV